MQPTIPIPETIIVDARNKAYAMLLKRFPPQDAEELVQEAVTTVLVYDYRTKKVGAGYFAFAVRQAAIRGANSAYTKQKRYLTVNDPADLDSHIATLASDSTLSGFRSRHTETLFRHALKRLPRDHERIFRLMLNGYTLQESAMKLGITMAAVRHRLEAARKLLEQDHLLSEWLGDQDKILYKFFCTAKVIYPLFN